MAKKKGRNLTTMRVHGRKVPLVWVREVLQNRNLRQADVAKRLNVHQTAVSQWLTGRVLPPSEFREFVERLTNEAAADNAAHAHQSGSGFVDGVARAAQSRVTNTGPGDPAGTWNAPPSAPADPHASSGSIRVAPPPLAPNGPASPPPPPAPNGPTYEQIDRDDAPHTPEPREEAEADEGVLSRPFPQERALQVVNLARKAQADGHISYPAGVRKLINWARAFFLLRSVRFSYEDALTGSYDVVVRSKTEPGSEDRKFAEESFRTVFGMDAAAAKVPPGAPNDQHPGYSLALPFVKAGLPVWFYGQAGTGKTHTAEVIAAEVAGKSYTVQCSRDMTKDDFVGSLGASNGETVKHYGPVALAMKEGVPLVLEEPSTAPAEILMILQQVLTGKPLLVTGMGEVEEIVAAEGFTVIACDNTVGLGEGIDYVGTSRMNEAFRDRFYFVEYGHMADDMTLRILGKHIDTFTVEQGWAKA